MRGGAPALITAVQGMHKAVLSLLAGMALPAGNAVIGLLTGRAHIVPWLLFSQIVWPGVFIWLYRRHSGALNPWVSLVGIALGVAVATWWAIGVEALLSVADFGAFVLGYLLYSAAIGPVILVTLFLIFHALRQRLPPRPARANPSCKGPSP